MFLDPLYLLLIIATLAISFAAQSYVKSTYRKYGQVRNGSGLTGLQVGQAILDRTSLGDSYAPDVLTSPGLQGAPAMGIRFGGTQGQLTDHFDPATNMVFLSQGVADQPSIASMAIVAHELGHAEQKEQASILMAMRQALVPAIRFSPMLAYVCIMLSFVFRISGLFSLGILFYAVMVGFIILDLPIEIDASRRATRLLRQANLIQTPDDDQGTRRMLAAAASTYVAAAVTAILQLLYYISIGRRRA